MLGMQVQYDDSDGCYGDLFDINLLPNIVLIDLVGSLEQHMS